MRLRSRKTRELLDAHWELPSNPLMGHPVLIVEDGEGGRPVPRAIAADYVLVVATLEEMRIGVDHGFRFHEQFTWRPRHANADEPVTHQR